ncbi:MAG: hypothetical protein R8G66_10155 [Cytophagales bacterium]|nr:hypothetical protein [Cytophagales bacterium]
MSTKLLQDPASTKPLEDKYSGLKELIRGYKQKIERKPELSNSYTDSESNFHYHYPDGTPYSITPPIESEIFSPGNDKISITGAYYTESQLKKRRIKRIPQILPPNEYPEEPSYHKRPGDNCDFVYTIYLPHGHFHINMRTIKGYKGTDTHPCTIIFSPGSLLFGNNLYLRDERRIKQCTKIIKGLLGINFFELTIKKYEYDPDNYDDFEPSGMELALKYNKISRIDQAINIETSDSIDDFFKYVETPPRWTKERHPDHNDGFYLFNAKSLESSQVSVCIYQKQPNLIRIEARIIQKPKGEQFNRVLRSYMGIERDTRILIQGGFDNPANKRFLFDKIIKQLFKPVKRKSIKSEWFKRKTLVYVEDKLNPY